MPIISDRPVVIELAMQLYNDNPRRNKNTAARQALQRFYSLDSHDGIWGGSDAAVCMGYPDVAPEENVLDRIMLDVAQQLPNRKT